MRKNRSRRSIRVRLCSVFNGKCHFFVQLAVF